jgi:hypothetical protein
MTTNGTDPLRSDLAEALQDELGREEARYLVDLYYQMQEYRKATANQARAAAEADEPHRAISLILAEVDHLEQEIKRALDHWTDQHHMGRWAKEQYGIGPVISAGLLAHLDISRAKTAGAIWRFAGLDPTAVWKKGQKRPYNASLKTLCWKIGDSFVKFKGREECFYGHLYEERKLIEVERNESGGNAEVAAKTLEERNIKDKATIERYESGRLPDGRIDLRARRWAVKLFLAHWFEEAYREYHGEEPPAPYPIAHLGHAHRIEAK